MGYRAAVGMNRAFGKIDVDCIVQPASFNTTLFECEQSATARVRCIMGAVVLIVEDEALLRANAVAFLEDSGFSVHEARNADQAIALLELHSDIQVVFTDIQMPGSMDGLKLAHYIRGRWPPVKLIITSGRERPMAEDIPVGSRFVGKPYLLSQVADHLRAAIG